FAGGLLIGCDAGTLNGSKIKGTHTAMKSGMIAADAVVEAILNQSVIADYQSHFKQSWLYEELYQARNFSSGIRRFGSWLGGGLAMLEHNVLKGKAKWNVRCEHPDHQSLILAENSDEILYPKPDGVLSFDRLSSVYEGAEQAELQINAANCIHCKTCDIKDPSQNITWTPPEGGGGPNYPNM
ncbi:4Fe-4S dicluster domain-containing protein, partial [Vibrio parahaemolyticus]